MTSNTADPESYLVRELGSTAQAFLFQLTSQTIHSLICNLFNETERKKLLEDVRGDKRIILKSSGNSTGVVD